MKKSALLLFAACAACGDLDVEGAFPRTNTTDPGSAYRLDCALDGSVFVQLQSGTNMSTSLESCTRIELKSEELLEIDVRGPQWTLTLELGMSTGDPYKNPEETRMRTVDGVPALGEAKVIYTLNQGGVVYVSKPDGQITANGFRPPLTTSDTEYLHTSIHGLDVAADGMNGELDAPVGIHYSISYQGM